MTVALDTSTRSCSVALFRGRNPLLELTQLRSPNHTETLLALLHAGLERCGLTLGEIRLVAVGLGPGSFTGLRIGLSVAKTLAWTQGQPLVGVCSLDAVAMNLPQQRGLISVMQDARKREVYEAAYRWEDFAVTRISAPRVIAPGEAARELAQLRRPGESLTLIGSGVAEYRDELARELPDHCCLPADDLAHHLRATAVAKLALSGPSIAAEDYDLIPIYVRKSEAELNWGKPRDALAPDKAV